MHLRVYSDIYYYYFNKMSRIVVRKIFLLTTAILEYNNTIVIINMNMRQTNIFLIKFKNNLQYLIV